MSLIWRVLYWRFHCILKLNHAVSYYRLYLFHEPYIITILYLILAIMFLLFNTIKLMYCLQRSAFCRLILVLVKLQYHATSSTPRQVCVRSLHMEAVAATRTTLKHWRSAINSATLMVNSTIIIMMLILELDLD